MQIYHLVRIAKVKATVAKSSETRKDTVQYYCHCWVLLGKDLSMLNTATSWSGVPKYLHALFKKHRLDQRSRDPLICD